MTESSTDRSSLPRASCALWLGLLGPPSVWLIAFQVKYTLAGAPVDSDRHKVVFIAGIVALGVIAAFGLLSWREWRLACASPLDRYAGVTARIRFMALLGMMGSALFFLATAAQVLASFFIEPGKI